MPNSTLLLGAAFVSSIGVADAADRSKYVPQGYVQTFDEEFTSLRTINPGPCCAAPGKNWFNGTEHCCMTPSVAGQIGSLYSAAKNGYSFYPYSLEESGKGLQITLTLHNNIWYSGVLTSEDNAGNGFSQQYGYFEISDRTPGRRAKSRDVAGVLDAEQVQPATAQPETGRNRHHGVVRAEHRHPCGGLLHDLP